MFAPNYTFAIFIENKREVEGYVEKALKRRIEQKIKDIEDYRLSTIYAKTINEELHHKMIDAEKKRATALYADLPSNFFEDGDLSGLPIFKLGNSKAKSKRSDKNTHLQVPSMRSRRQSLVSCSKPIELEFDADNAKLQVKAFNEAFRILMKESEKRKAIRIKQKTAALKAKNRILAVWAFRKKQEEKKKLDIIQKEKMEKKIGIYSSKNTSAFKNAENEEKDEEDEEEQKDNVSNTNTSDSGNGGSNSSETGQEKCATKDNKQGSNEHEKRIIVIEDLKTRLDLKKKQQKPGNKYYLNNSNFEHSEKRKWEDAKHHLVRLKEQQGKRNPVSAECVEAEKRRKIPKFKDVVMKVMRINAVHNAFKVIRKNPRLSEELEDAAIETLTNKCEVEGIKDLFLQQITIFLD